MDGWVQRYWVDVGDEEIQVDVSCSGTAVAMAPRNDEIKSVVRDRGRAWAIRTAEHSQPARLATALVRCDSNGVSVSYEYGRPPRRSGDDAVTFAFRDTVTTVSGPETTRLILESRRLGNVGADAADILEAAQLASRKKVGSELGAAEAGAIVTAIDRLAKRHPGRTPGLRRLRNALVREYGES